MRGILFDSGDTLIRPVGGRWNPRYDFEEVVLRHHPHLSADALEAAFPAGQQVLNAGPTTPDRTTYHRAILDALGIAEPTRELLDELKRPAAGPVVEPFPEVRTVLTELRQRGVRMAIVSDTWVGLEDLYDQLGLAEFFEVYVISETLGCCKPDPRMYGAGSDGLGLRPDECLFVDNDPELVAAAIALGYHGTTIARGADKPTGTPWISTLEELV